MAKDGVHLAFAGLHDNHFYFHDCKQDEVDTDTFECWKTSQKLIRCPDNKFLILNEENKFHRTDLNIQQQSCSDYKLNITIYRDLGLQSMHGRAVMLHALKGDRKYAAVCKNDTEVSAEEVQELQRIEAPKHEALFYMSRDEQTNRYKLKSSVYPEKALGFDETDLNKLILRPYDPENHYDTISILE